MSEKIRKSDEVLDDFLEKDTLSSVGIFFAGVLLDVLASEGNTSFNNLKMTIYAFFIGLGFLSIKGVQALSASFAHKIKAKLEEKGLTMEENIQMVIWDIQDKILSILKRELECRPQFYFKTQKIIQISIKSEGKPFPGHPQNWKKGEKPRSRI